MKIKSKNYLWLIYITQLIFCETAFSGDMDISKSPVRYSIGSLELSPVFEIGEYYNDNIFLRNQLTKPSFVTQIHAGAQLNLKRKINHYSLTYALQSSHYHSSPEDDYVDHYVGINTHNEFTSRSRFDFDINYFDSHYMRGFFLNTDTINPILGIPSPIQYHLINTKAKYTYGNIGAKSNMDLLMNIADYTFDNFSNLTAPQNRTSPTITLGFNYRVFPNTTLRTELENTWILHSDSKAADFDNSKHNFIFGGTWQYSKQFQTNLKLGYLHLELNNGASNSIEYNDVTWNANLLWSPFTYSRLSLNAARNAAISVNSANVRTFDRFLVNWTHDWSNRLTTVINTSYESASNLSINRNDNFLSVLFDLNYGVRRWLGFGINYTYRQLNSDDRLLDFNQNTILFYVTANPRLSDDVKTPWITWY